MDHFWSSNPATNEDRSVAYQDKTISSSNVESKGCTAQQNVTSPVDSGHAECGSHGNVANDRYIADQKMNEDDGWLSEKYAEQDHALKKSRRKQDTPARMSHHNEGETLSGSDLKLYSESGPIIPRYSGYSENFIDDEMALLEGTSDHEYCYDQQEDFVERLKKSRKLYKSNRVTSEDNSDGSESSSDEDNSEDMTNAIADIAAQLETDEEAGNDKGPSRKRKMKTFQCQLCLFSSKDSYALAIHMQTHLGKCPYSCRSCRESYRRRNGLKRHILRAHPEKVEELISCISEDYNLKLRDLFLSSVRYNNRSGLSDMQEHSDISTSEQNFTVSHNFTERNLSKKKPVGFVSPISNEGINTSQQMETLPPAGQETYVPANDHYARSTFGIKKKSKKQLYVVLRPIDLDTDFNHPSKDSERNDSLPNFSVEGVESPNNGSEKAHVDNYQRKNDVEWGPTPCDSNLDGLPPQLDEVIDNQKYSRAKSFTSESLSPPTLEPIEHCSKKSGQLMSFQYESKSIRDLSSKEFANPQPTITVGFAVAEDTQDPVTRTSQLSDTQDIASHENVNENQISDVIKLSSSSRSEDQSTYRYSVQNAGNGDSFADTNMNSNCGSVAAFAGDESNRRFKQCNNNISANASGKMETAVDIHSPEDGGKIMTQTESSEKTEFANEEKGLPSEDEKHGRLTSLSPKHNIDSSALKLRGDENVEGIETQSKPEYLVSLSPLKEKSDSLSSLETLSKLQSIAVRVDSASKETPEKVAKDLPSASHDDQGSMNQPASAQELAADGNLSLHQLLAKSRYIPEADNAKVDVKVKKPMSAKVSDIVRVAASIKQDIATHRHHMHTCREDLSDFKSEMEFLVRSKNFQIGSFSVTAKVRHISSGQIQVAYECPLCQHLFTSYKGLNFHYRRKHKNDSMEEAVRKEAQNIRSEEVLLPEGQFFLEGQPTQGHPHPMHMRPVSAALYLGRLAEVNRTIAEQNYQKGGSEHQAGHTTAEEDLRRHPTTPVSPVATAQHFHQNLLASPVVPMQPIHQQAEIVSGHRSFIPQANMPAGLPPNQHGKEVINPSHFQRTVNENNPVDLSKKADMQQYRRQESLQTVQTVTNENMTVIHTNRNIQTTSTQAVIQSSQGLQTLQKEPLMSPRPSQHQVQMLSGIVPQQAYPGTMHPPGHINVKPISSATQNGDDQRGRNLISDMSQLPQGQFQRRHSTSMEQTSNTGIPNVSTGVSHHSGHHYSQVSLLHQTYDVVSPNRMRHPPASQFPASGSHQNTLSQDTQSVTTSAGQSVVVDLSLRQQNPQSVIHSDSPMAYTSTLVPQIQTQHAARDDVSAAKAQVSMSPWLPIPTTQPDEMYRQKLLKVPVLAQGQQPMLIYTQDQHASTSVNRVVGIEGNQTNQTSVNIHKMPNRSMEMLSPKTLGKETPVKHTVDLSVRPKPKFLTPAPGKPFSKTLFGRFIDTFNTPLSSGTKRMPPLKVPNPTVIQRPPSSQDLIPKVSRITTAATTVSSLHVQETQSTTPTLPVNQMFLNDPRRPVQMQLVPMPQCLPSQQAAQYMGMDMPSNSPGYAASANEPRVNQTITSSSQLTPKRGSFVPQPQLNLNLLRTPGQPRALMQAGCQPFQVDMGKEHGNQFRQPNLQRLHASTMPNVRMVYPPREAYGMHYPAMESRPDVSKVSEEISNMASLVNRLPPSKKTQPMLENFPLGIYPTSQESELPAVYARVLGATGRIRPIKDQEAVCIATQLQSVNKIPEVPLDLSAKPKLKQIGSQSDQAKESNRRDPAPANESPLDLTIKNEPTKPTIEKHNIQNKPFDHQLSTEKPPQRKTVDCPVPNPDLMPVYPTSPNVNPQQMFHPNQMMFPSHGIRMPTQMIQLSATGTPSTIGKNVTPRQMQHYQQVRFAMEARLPNVRQDQIFTMAKSQAIMSPSGKGFMFQNMPIITDVRSLQESDPQAARFMSRNQQMDIAAQVAHSMSHGQRLGETPLDIRQVNKIVNQGTDHIILQQTPITSPMKGPTTIENPGEINRVPQSVQIPMNPVLRSGSSGQINTKRGSSIISVTPLDLSKCDIQNKETDIPMGKHASEKTPIAQSTLQHSNQSPGTGHMTIPATSVQQPKSAKSQINQPTTALIQGSQISPQQGITPLKIPQSPLGTSVGLTVSGAASPRVPGPTSNLQTNHPATQLSDTLPVYSSNSIVKTLPSPSSEPATSQHSPSLRMPVNQPMPPPIRQPTHIQLNTPLRPPIPTLQSPQMRPPGPLQHQITNVAIMPPPPVSGTCVVSHTTTGLNLIAPPVGSTPANLRQYESEKSMETLGPHSLKSPNQASVPVLSAKPAQMIQADDISSSEGMRIHNAGKANQEIATGQCQISALLVQKRPVTSEIGANDVSHPNTEASHDPSRPTSNTTPVPEQQTEVDTSPSRPKRRRLASFESGVATTTKKDDPSSDAEILKSFVKTGKHKCPFCFYSNYSRKEVRIHIKQEHFNKQKKKNQDTEHESVSSDNTEIEESPNKRTLQRQESLMSSVSEVSHTSGLTCESLDDVSDVDTNLEGDAAFQGEATDIRDDESIGKSSEASKLSENTSFKDDDDSLSCTKCEIDFMSVVELEEHFRVAHCAKGIEEECQLCEFTSDQSYVMHKHMERYHSREKPYQCEKSECYRSFATLEDLHRHSRRHDSDKKFMCDLCGAKYHWQNGLRAHMLRHTVNYPYECTHCGLRFKTSGMLKRHEYEKKHLPPENIGKPDGAADKASFNPPQEIVRKRGAKVGGRGRGCRK